MKKIPIEISDEIHKELLRVQFERKLKGMDRTTIKEVASDLLTECLEKRAKTKNPDK